MKRTQRYTIDGQTYDSLEAMPPAVRRKWDAMSPLLDKARAQLAAGSAGTTTVKLEERVEFGPGDPDPLLQQTLADGGGTARLGVRARTLSTIVLVLLFATLTLAGWGFFSRVRITMAYGPGWWVAAGVLTLSLTVGLGWGMRRGPASAQPNLKTILALLVGMGAISAEAVFGGVPAVAHQLTSVSGERTVSVIAKQERYSRYRCAPRVIIAEFTYVLRDYLCTGRRAFAEIQVGSKIRIEGEVSDYGVTPDVFTWGR